jgi:hypothetical protein
VLREQALASTDLSRGLSELRRAANRGGMAMTIIETTLSKDAASDPQMLITFLHYALDDVRKLSERSARLLEHAINALAQEAQEAQEARKAAMTAHRQSLS